MSASDNKISYVPQVYYKDYLDVGMKPDGGEVESVGIQITWQRGPLRTDGSDILLPANGAFVETVIEVAKHRLEFYQTTQFRCEENAEAIKKLEEAIEVLQSRIKRRAAAGTLGTHNGS
jgi:hypothetical protein